MRVIGFLFGLILLFPGACALGYMALGVTLSPDLKASDWLSPVLWIIIAVALGGWGICFLVSYGGVRMMRYALKPDTRKPPPGD